MRSPRGDRRRALWLVSELGLASVSVSSIEWGGVKAKCEATGFQFCRRLRQISKLGSFFCNAMRDPDRQTRYLIRIIVIMEPKGFRELMRAAWAVSPPSGLTHASVIKPPGGEHGGDVIARPELEPVENSRERLAERRNCVFDRNWRRRLDSSGDQPVALHLFQRLR